MIVEITTDFRQKTKKKSFFNLESIVDEKIDTIYGLSAEQKKKKLEVGTQKVRTPEDDFLRKLLKKFAKAKAVDPAQTSQTIKADHLGYNMNHDIKSMPLFEKTLMVYPEIFLAAENVPQLQELRTNDTWGRFFDAIREVLDLRQKRQMVSLFFFSKKSISIQWSRFHKS